MTFTREGEEYVFSLFGEVKYRTKFLAFAFDAQDGTLLHHGDVESVTRYADHLKSVYRMRGCPEFADVIVVVSSDQWWPGVINRFVEHTDAIKEWYDAVVANKTPPCWVCKGAVGEGRCGACGRKMFLPLTP